MKHFDLTNKPGHAIQDIAVADGSALDAGTFYPDLSVARIFRVTVTADATVAIGNPKNVRDGSIFFVTIVLVGTGAVTWGNKWQLLNEPAGAGQYPFLMKYDAKLDKILGVLETA